MSPSEDAVQRLDRTTLWGARVAVTAAVVMVVAFVGFYVSVFLGHPEVDQDLIEGFEVGDLTETLSAQQRWVLALLWMVPDLLGIAMMVTAARLFYGFRQIGVFNEVSTRRIKRIGWCILAIAPARMLAFSIGAAYAAASMSDPSGRFYVSIEDLDIYAVIIGLLFIAIGHVMTQAVDISNENKSFV